MTTRLTPQDAFSIRVTASLLREFHAKPQLARIESFTRASVMKDALGWMKRGDSKLDLGGVNPQGNGLLLIADALDSLERYALTQPPLTGAELVAYLKHHRRR